MAFPFLMTMVKLMQHYVYFFKQLGLGLSSQSCLYFQDFWDLKLFNGCLVVTKIDICNQRF